MDVWTTNKINWAKPYCQLLIFNLVGTEMRNKGLQAAVKQSSGVTVDLKKRTHSKSV